MVEQIVTDRCVDMQIDALEAKLLHESPFVPLANAKDKASIPFVLRAPQRIYSDGAWRIVTTEGVASHLPLDLRYEIDRIYMNLDQMEALARQNAQLQFRLNSLAMPVRLSDDSRNQLVQDLEGMRGRTALMTLIARQTLGVVEYVGMLPTRDDMRVHMYSSSGTIGYCRAHHMPLDQLTYARAS